MSRLPYDILACTSEDAPFGVTELLRGSEDVGQLRGWQTAKNCHYPQEIVFRFSGDVHLTQLQLLSHECKISTRVEVHVFQLGTKFDPEDPPSFDSVKFQKLGSVKFNTNEKSKYRSKERKTVHLKATCYFLKLVFQRNHSNPLNAHNQVGIYSVVAAGEPISHVHRHVDPAFAPPDEYGSGADEDYYPDQGPAHDPTPPRGFLPPVPGAQGKQNASRSPQPVGDDNVYNYQRQNNMPADVTPQKHFSPNNMQQHQTPPRQLPPPGQRYAAGGGAAVAQQRRGTDPYSGTPQRPLPAPSNQHGGAGASFLAYRSQRIIQFENFYQNKADELTVRKAEAIEIEDFDEAKAAKEALVKLHSLGDRIYKLEEEKVRAIYDEDFETANDAKAEMNKLVKIAMAIDGRSQAGRDADGGGRSKHPGHANDVRRRRNQDEDYGRGGRGGDAEVGNFEDQPVVSKYAQEMARQQREQNPEEDADEADRSPKGRGKKNRRSNPASPTSGDEDEADDEEAEEEDEAEEEEDAEDEAEEEEEDEEEGDEDNDSRASPSPKSSKSPSPKANKQKKKNTGENDPAAAEGNAGVLGKFDPETFPDWEKGAYAAIHDMVGAENEEPPAEPIDHSNPEYTAIPEFNATIGHYTTACLFSRRWRLRDAAIRVLTTQLGEHYRHLKGDVVMELLLRYCDLKNYGMCDTIQQIFMAVSELITKICEGTIDDCQFTSVQTPVMNLLPRIVFRAGDANQKTREEAGMLILTIAASPIGPERVGYAMLADPVDSDKRRIANVHPRLLVSRLMVLRQVLSVHEISYNKPLSTDAIMSKLVLPCLNHSNNEVREQALMLIDRIDSGQGQIIYKYVPKITNAAMRGAVEEKLGAPPEAGSGAEDNAPADKSSAQKRKPASKKSGGAAKPKAAKEKPETADDDDEDEDDDQ